MAQDEKNQTDTARRKFLTNCGKLAATVPPAMTVLLSTSLTSPAIAMSAGEPKEKCNNGVGNGQDCQPPGNPPINDGQGTGPGNPGNRGGRNRRGGNGRGNGRGGNGRGNGNGNRH